MSKAIVESSGDFYPKSKNYSESSDEDYDKKARNRDRVDSSDFVEESEQSKNSLLKANNQPIINKSEVQKQT